MNTKRLYSVHSVTQIGLVIAIVIVLNVLLVNVSLRLDLTQNKDFTLSSASQQIVSQLKQPVTIKLFFSKDVPQNMLALKQDVKDILQEYKTAGKNNVILQETDPKSDPTAAQQAQTYGIPQIQYNIVGNEQFQVSTGYAGMALVYGNTYQTIPTLSDTGTLEYDMTAAIQKMSNPTPATIGWLSDHGVATTSAIQQQLSKQYTITPETLDKLDPKIQTLVLAGPTTAFTDKEDYQLDQFVMHGGNLIVLVDGMAVDQSTLQTSANKTNLDKILTAYGITPHQDLIADFGSPTNLNFGQGGQQVIQPYPFWVQVIPAGLNPNSPITAKLQSITLPWPSSLTVATPTGAQVTGLITTSPQAYAYNQSTSVDPHSITLPATKAMQQYVLGALATGKLPSAFTSATIPSDATASNFVDSVTNGHVAVFSNAQFITDNVLASGPDNSTVVLNTIDAFAQGENLIGIRSRTALNRPLSVLTNTQKTVIKYSNIFSGLAIVLVMGGLAFFRRKQTDRKAKNLYA